MKTTTVIEIIGSVAQVGAGLAPGPFGLILGLIAKYGTPTAVKLIEGLGKEEITVEDIQKLHDLVKLPEDYFAQAPKEE